MAHLANYLISCVFAATGYKHFRVRYLFQNGIFSRIDVNVRPPCTGVRVAAEVGQRRKVLVRRGDIQVHLEVGNTGVKKILS